MAVQAPFKEITVEDSKTLEYIPPAGSAAIVTDVFCLTDSLDVLVMKIGNRTVQAYHVGPQSLNQALPPVLNMTNKSVTKCLKSIGLPTEYPVAEGEKLVLQTSNTAKYLGIHFKEVAPEDIKPDMPNAKSSKESLIFIHGTNMNDITETGWHRLDKCLNPSEMHSWPFEEVACPFNEIHIYSIASPPYQENTYPSGSNAYATQKRLRIWRGTELLFHPKEEGFITKGDGAEAGSYNYNWDSGYNELPMTPYGEEENIFVFPEPLIFKRGEEMAIEIYTDIDTNAKVPAQRLICSIIGKIIKSE